MTIQVSATFEYSGLPDYWAGNGLRWSDDHACVFAFYGPQTTLRELIDEMARDDCDQDDKPLFEAIGDDAIHAALIEMLTPLGVAGLDEIAECAREYGDANGHDYTLTDDDAERECDCCDLDSGGDMPQIICLLSLTCDVCELDASECECVPSVTDQIASERPCYECAERINAGRERCPICPYAQGTAQFPKLPA